LGGLRFRKPEPVDDWHGVHEATQLPNACPQEASGVYPGFKGEEMWNPNTPVSEDCLYLNLWVPTKFRHNNNAVRVNNATVMIWIHGGGYTTGSSSLDIYDGITLAAMNDVIVASFNYRLGALGFLYLGTDEAPGNMGLYDQAMAMQWIKDNIDFFGGNSDDITVFSESAGSGSLSSHLLSPVSSHLIKRAIIQSGVVTAPWSHLTAESARNFSLFLAKDVGCFTEDFSSGFPTLDEAATMNCLKGIDPRSITQAQGNSYSAVLHYSWAPTVRPKMSLYLLKFYLLIIFEFLK
jgi:acetylcholinesterase